MAAALDDVRAAVAGVSHPPGARSDVRVRHRGRVLRMTSGDAGATAGRDVFYAGSVAKQFTAAAVLLLAFDGALALDDPVGRFVPGLPPGVDEVTLDHVLRHTSGIRVEYVQGLGDMDNERALAAFRRAPALAFPPGTAWEYSSAYVLLAEVVRAASGRSLGAFAADRIFRPLGMERTVFRESRRQDLPGALAGVRHARDPRVEPASPPIDPAANFFVVGDGGLWTTADDLVRWDENLDRDALAGGRLAAGLTAPGRLRDGTPLEYGRGLAVRRHRGRRMASHGGGFPGWAAKLVRFPDDGLSVVWLANTSALDVHALAMAVADRLLDAG